MPVGLVPPGRVSEHPAPAGHKAAAFWFPPWHFPIFFSARGRSTAWSAQPLSSDGRLRASVTKPLCNHIRVGADFKCWMWWVWEPWVICIPQLQKTCMQMMSSWHGSSDTCFTLWKIPDYGFAKVLFLVNKGDKCALGMYMAMSDLSNV